MFLAKKILAGLLLPPFSLLLLAFLGLWLILRNRGRQRPVGVALLSLALTALVALSLPAVGDRLLRSLEIYPPISASQLAEAQAIVILGGGLYHDAPEYGGDTVGSATLERIRYGARLARSSKLPVLVTGGAARGGLPEAQVMREVLGSEFGVRVQWTESASFDTAENARYSATQLRAAGITRIALISQGWHLRRAVPLFQQEGLTVVAAPTKFTLPTGNPVLDWLPGDFRDSRLAVNEYLGIAVNQLRALF